ncbi:MAG TPA: hypothetical protein VFE91_05095 [Nitrososphaerales archaeon]|nr:hypothetical protein [Nitrososphaerales archaeon]
MSTEQVAGKAKETIKALKEALERAEEAAQKGISKAAPAIQKSLDNSLEAASKGFASTMKTIDSVTEREQLPLLRAYGKFLSGQAEYVEARVKVLEERASTTKSSA